MYIRTGGRNWPEALQNAITVIFSFFSLDVKILTFLEPFSVMTESGFYLYATFFNVETVPRCIGKFIFGRHFLQHFKNVPTMFRFLFWARAKKKRCSAIVSCTFRFIMEIIWSSHVSSKPVFKICCSGCLNTREDFYGFIFISRNNDLVQLEETAIEQIIFVLWNVYA